jgi:hypothetical protein
MFWWRTVRWRLLLGLAVAALLTVGVVGAAGSGSAAAGAGAGAGSVGGWTGVDPVPPEIAVPPGNRLVARFNARGVQVYGCTGGVWGFLEPAAVLTAWYQPVAVHFRGPSWESVRDGSLVEGRVVASSPVAGSIPQLLLQASRTRGEGVFGGVTYIQRLATSGGVAPTTGCVDGQSQGVGYTAVYRFYVAS